MNRGWMLGIVCSTVAFFAYAEEPSLESRVSALEKKAESESSSSLQAKWKNGFVLSSVDGNFEMQPRVLFQVDAASYFGKDDVNEALAAGVEEGETPDEIQNGAEFRRARFGFEGTLYKDFEYEIVYDFAGGDAVPKDVYLGLTQIPVLGTVRIGHQREPFARLQGSDSQRIFMEKGLQDSLAPDRSLGVRVLNGLKDGKLAWSAGAFYITDDTGSSVGQDSYALTARLASLPWEDKKNDRRVHVGVSGSYRHPDEEKVDFGTKPESHLAEDMIGRDKFSASDVELLGTEGAVQLGAFMVLGEYIVADVADANDAGDATCDGYHVTASYILTGEHREYNLDEDRLGKVKPAHNFREGGWGAWEVAARVSGLDLTDTDPSEGKMQDYSVGLNWYLNPVTRFMLDYIYTDAEAAGDMQIVQARVQLDL